MSVLREPKTTQVIPSSPIPIRRCVSPSPDHELQASPCEFECSEPLSVPSPRMLHPRPSLHLPSIFVIDSHGNKWKSGEIVQIHEETPSPSSSIPSKSASYCDLAVPSPSASSHSLSDLQSEGTLDRRSLSHNDVRSLTQGQNSENLFGSTSTGADLANSRFTSSHKELEQVGSFSGTKSKRKVKKKFLSVEDSDMKLRNRSASTGEVMYLPSSSQSTRGRMRKFLQRLRSQSQGDIIVPPTLKSHSSYNSKEDINNVNMGTSYSANYDDIPPTAINTSLLSKIKKHIGKQQRRKSSGEFLIKSQRRNSDFINNNKNLGMAEDYSEILNTNNSSSQEDLNEYVLNIPKETRKRSKSETRFPFETKPKKKGILEINLVSKFKERNRQRKRERAGSLPNVLDDDGLKQRLKGRSATNTNNSGTRRRSSTYHDGEEADKTVFMGDFAIDDYFGENGESLSMENLVEDQFIDDKDILKNNHSKYSLENILSNFRGKSRSMDYTLQRPFDLETLKRKLGERTSSEPSRAVLDASEAGVGGRGEIPADRKDSPRTLLSGPVISYTVQSNDTLMSIAARFDTTPSELTKMNRLSTRFLFPGQILTVPDKGGAKENLAQGLKDETDSFKDPHASPNHADLALPKSLLGGFPKTPANSVDTDRSLDKECLEKFLKIQVRHITDGQGVVAGVLLVTPNAVMFDPNVSDPLVIERGSESYGVIAPMDFVVNAALYYDIAHMKVKDSGLPKPDIPKPEIYYGPTEAPGGEEVVMEAGERLLGGSEESPSKEGAFPELIPGGDGDGDNDSSCSCGGDTRETSAFPKAFEHELLTPISSDASPTGGGAAGDAAPAPPPFVVQGGDLTPIVEGPKSEDGVPRSPTPAVKLPQATPPAQSQCDTKKPGTEDVAQKTPLTISSSLPPLSQPSPTPQSPLPLHQTQPHQLHQPQLTNDKKRTTSVTFSTSSESDMPPLPEDEGLELPSQESRKQKVLKRISYPLSWMESLGGDAKADSMGAHHHQQNIPSSAPPGGNWMGSSAGGGHPAGVTGDIADASRQGMFSNVFSMSNVSNMLTRRTSLDFVRRPSGQGSEHLNTNTSSPPVLSADLNPLHQAHKRAQFKEGPKFGLKSMVSMDDMPDLFASFDKLIPKPASSCEESPLYLCLRMGTPVDRAIPRATPIMTYGKKTMRPEYWFSIPKNRTDELYHFFQIWASEIYGELDEETVKNRGFSLIEEEIEIWPQGAGNWSHDGGIDAAGELKEMTKESWEVASMSEELRKALYSSSSLTSLDIEVFLPEVQGSTEIIDDYIRKNMYRKLPARVQGYNWKLVFSSAQHGFSLKSLYRKMTEIESAILLFIQDTNQNKFGAFLSCPLRVSELFYGNGESFLFVCQPEFKVFPWTGENTFFVKGNNESLYVGGGDGNFGIWLDGDLYQGRTQSCKTFGNPLLTTREDFIIKTIECWYFD